MALRSRFASGRALVDRDAITHVPRKELRPAVVSIFDRIQGFPKAVQMVAIAAAFSLMCAAARLRPADVGEVADRIMKDNLTASGMDPQFEAMKYHLETELLGVRPE